MINVDVQGINPEFLLRAASLVLEKRIAGKAKSAAPHRGWVTNRCARTPDFTIRSLELRGSQAAIKAAMAAIAH